MPRSSSNKDFKFSAEITLLRSGKVKPGVIIPAEKVAKLFNSELEKKGTLHTVAKVHGDNIAFKKKLPSGNKKKKLLRYDGIVLMDQSTDDRRKLFLQYEKPTSSYYFLLGFNDRSNISDLIQLVSAANNNVLLRGEQVLELDSKVNNELQDAKSEQSDKREDCDGYVRPTRENFEILSSRDESDDESPLPKFILNGAVACVSYISPFDDEIDDPSSLSPRNDANYTEKIQSRSDLEQHADNQFHYEAENSRTTYTYVGPEDGEESMNGDSLYMKHQSMGQTIRKPKNSISGNRKISELESIVRSSPKMKYSSEDVYSARSHRSKSRQLPLSEDEKIRSGWHSGYMFVTPRAGGVNDITEDGPVVLFSASRANIGNTSDDDDFDDSDEDISWSSSTLTDEDEVLLQNNSSRFMSGLPRRN